MSNQESGQAREVSNRLARNVIEKRSRSKVAELLGKEVQTHFQDAPLPRSSAATPVPETSVTAPKSPVSTANMSGASRSKEIPNTQVRPRSISLVAQNRRRKIMPMTPIEF